MKSLVLYSAMMAAFATLAGAVTYSGTLTSTDAGGHDHSLHAHSAIAQEANEESGPSVLVIERADGRVDTYSLDFIVDFAEPLDDAILVSGHMDGRFYDFARIDIAPGDRLVGVGQPSRRDGVEIHEERPFPTPVKRYEKGAVQPDQPVEPLRPIIVDDPRIGPDGPEPPPLGDLLTPGGGS